MDKFNPRKHHRRSIRLHGYDYSQPGLYFVTICVQNRVCLFGYVENGQMILNAAGKMVEKWYYELEKKFPDIHCHEMIVMPNHFHCIIENNGTIPVVADLRVCPDSPTGEQTDLGEHDNILGEHAGSPLQRAVQWFKTMTTNEYIRGVKNYGWEPFNGKLWQRNYYEHIIRNDHSFYAISDYIHNNPANWFVDRLNSKKP